MEVNGKPMKEMDVQEVKEFIEQEFESGVAEKFDGMFDNLRAISVDVLFVLSIASRCNKA